MSTVHLALFSRYAPGHRYGFNVADVFYCNRERGDDATSRSIRKVCKTSGLHRENDAWSWSSARLGKTRNVASKMYATLGTKNEWKERNSWWRLCILVRTVWERVDLFQTSLALHVCEIKNVRHLKTGKCTRC